MHEKLGPLLYLSNNWISRIGVYLVSAAGVFWLFMLPTYLEGRSGASAYIGILLYLVLPAVFFTGLALIPLGIAIRRRRGGPSAPMGDLRQFLTFLGLATAANVIIAAN